MIGPRRFSLPYQFAPKTSQPPIIGKSHLTRNCTRCLVFESVVPKIRPSISMTLQSIARTIVPADVLLASLIDRSKTVDMKQGHVQEPWRGIVCGFEGPRIFIADDGRLL